VESERAFKGQALMRLKIKNRRDGSFDCRLANGRKVHGVYGFDPVTRLPRALSLFIMTKDHVGYPKAVVANYDVTGYLGNSELLEYAETLDRRAAALELGIPSAPSVIQIDLTNPNRA
jgi:hypothetical protein